MQPSEHERMYRAETRHFWFVGTRTVIMSILERFSGSTLEGKKLLDVGCGTGYTLTRLPASVSAVGLDYSSAALDFARKRAPHADFVRGSAYALPFADNEFDVVLALDVLEHLDDDLLAAREIARVLKPGGIVVASVPAFRWLWSGHDEVLEHRRRYTLPEFETVLESAGLAIAHATHYNTLLFPIVATLRLIERVRGVQRQESQLDVPPGFINRPLSAILSSERFLAPRFRMPVGVSCLVVGRAAEA